MNKIHGTIHNKHVRIGYGIKWTLIVYSEKDMNAQNNFTFIVRMVCDTVSILLN